MIIDKNIKTIDMYPLTDLKKTLVYNAKTPKRP